MSTLEDVRTLRDTSLRLLPGFCQARATMDMAIEMLEYFAREAEHELTTGIRQDHGPISREVASHIRIMRGLMSAFARLHQPPD
jgi:hypothetical protein